MPDTERDALPEPGLWFSKTGHGLYIRDRAPLPEQRRFWRPAFTAEQMSAYAEQARSRPSAPEWRPIAEAPKDGTTVILSGDGKVSPGGWVSDIDHGAEWEGQIGMADWWILEGHFVPTHFQPLPAAPKE